MDAVPGIETSILVTPTRTGEFEVVCAELCGLGHATMRAKARVVTRVEFDDGSRSSARDGDPARDRRQPVPGSLRASARLDWKAFFGAGLARSLDGARGVRARRAPCHGAPRLVGLGPDLDDGGDPRRRRDGARADRVPGPGSGRSTTGSTTSRAGPTEPEDHSGHGGAQLAATTSA